ncbi:MAG: DUF3822 family protein [Muribaculaceae bacterium]|nr:DUF3822 family protein [Muribaculaceae bacterium]
MAETPTGHLDKDMIDDAQLWHLAMRIDHKTISVAVTSTVRDNSLIYREISLDTSVASWQASIEDAVYANPLLLSDFSRIDIAVDTEWFTVIPSEITDNALQQRITDTLFRDMNGENEPMLTLADPIAGTGATLLAVIPTGVENFLRRTFFNANIRHCVSVLAQYFHTREKLGNSGKLFVHIHPGSVTMIAFNHDSLAMANRLRTESTADAMYYIMAAREKLTESGDIDDQILVSGDSTLRDSIVPTLREYVPYVMPLFFPASLLKAGHEAINAPLELSVMHICE